jgi:hypothetical protein
MGDAAWHLEIEDAGTIGDAVTLMRDYLARVTPQQLARLPESCRPLRVKAEDDIEYWTWCLSQAPAPDGDVDADIVHEVFTHFLHASLKISRIHRERARSALLTR